jgi:hypothetical protein
MFLWVFIIEINLISSFSWNSPWRAFQFPHFSLQVTFESNSKLCRIDGSAISWCPTVKSICIPDILQQLINMVFGLCSCFKRCFVGLSEYQLKHFGVYWDNVSHRGFSSGGIEMTQLDHLSAIYSFVKEPGGEQVFFNSRIKGSRGVRRLDWLINVNRELCEIRGCSILWQMASLLHPCHSFQRSDTQYTVCPFIPELVPFRPPSQ